MASILVIGDDDGVRALLRLWLEEAGHTVWETMNGRDGTREFRKAPIDLVTSQTSTCRSAMDWDVIRRLRRLHAKLPILAISGGSGTMDYLRMAQSEGASRVLYKPFTVGIVLKTVAELLTKQPD